MDNLYVFPLKLVIFPESNYPLHIFEEKYIKLVNRSIDNSEPFGVSLMTGRKLYDVGCGVVVTQLLNKFDDGKMDIIVGGVSRYKIKDYKYNETGLVEARAEFFEDISEPINYANLKVCVDYYNQIAEALETIKIPPLRMEEINTKKPSFLIAQKAGLTLLQRQKLLESNSENKRLKTISSHLEKMIPLLKEAEIATQIIRNDGYFKNKEF